MGKHSIQLTSSEPIRIKAWYHLPFAPREAVDKELDSMSANGVIEPSATSYALQIVVVKNPMAPMAYPLIPVSWIRSQFLTRGLCNKCEMFFWLNWVKVYFFKIWFCKWYWQVPMCEEDKDFAPPIRPRLMALYKCALIDWLIDSQLLLHIGDYFGKMWCHLAWWMHQLPSVVLCVSCWMFCVTFATT